MSYVESLSYTSYLFIHIETKAQTRRNNEDTISWKILPYTFFEISNDGSITLLAFILNTLFELAIKFAHVYADTSSFRRRNVEAHNYHTAFIRKCTFGKPEAWREWRSKHGSQGLFRGTWTQWWPIFIHIAKYERLMKLRKNFVLPKIFWDLVIDLLKLLKSSMNVRKTYSAACCCFC